MASVLQDDDALSGLSLLSLSAAAAKPIPITPSSAGVETSSVSHSGSAPKSRRLSSSGKSRRRLSDARDAAIRLSVAPSTIHSPTSGVSLPVNNQDILASSSPAVSVPTRASSARIAMSRSVPLDSDLPFTMPTTRDSAVSPDHAVSVNKGGRKKSSVYTCESCSKVYRHPSCLIKHRWEHSPQWREASKFVLSKHQQVQLLEAAAILSHMDPSSDSGTSLPDDRAQWPAFLSGGTLLPPHAAHAGPISSSVPAYGTFAGPRLHDYPLPGGSVTQLRPGLLGVPTTSEVTPSVPVPRRPRGASGSHTLAPSSYSYRSPPAAASLKSPTHSRSYSNDSRWSQPPSSLRSMSRSSPSEEDEEELETDFVDDHANLRVTAGPLDTRGRAPGVVHYAAVHEEEDEMALSVNGHEPMDTIKSEQGEWDGMEMEMEMD